QDGHYLAAFDAENSAAQDLTRVGVDHCFHHASRFTHLTRTRNPIHRQPRDTDLVALLHRFALCQPDATKLRADENRVRPEAVLDRHVAAFDYIRADDPKIVVRDVRERGSTAYVTQGVDAWDIGAQPVVSRNKAVCGGLDAGRAEVQVVSIRRATGCHQQMRA